MVSVQVFSKDRGKPLQSACVGIQVGTNGVAFAYTNSNGEAHFPPISPGNYDVYVNDCVAHRGRIEGKLVLYV